MLKNNDLSTVGENVEPGRIGYLPWPQSAPKAPNVPNVPMLKSKAIAMMALPYHEVLPIFMINC